MDFSTFHKLKKLEVPLVLLIGAFARARTHLTNRLPEQLQTIHLNDDLAQFNDYPWNSLAMLDCFENDLPSLCTE